uniref:CTP synthase n=1 Tax=Trichuris muris TaxID=70415 RepID=A0A5S6R1R2_TRIMR
MKYILVTGGVASGIGKATIATSIGVILQCHGVRVTVVRLDPKLNIDSSRCTVKDHGEIFVLDDGSELDAAFGDYENFLNIRLTGDHNITGGKIYSEVISKASRGEYGGQKVKVFPHICDAVHEHVTRVANRPIDGIYELAEVCIIDLKGTVGDMQSAAFIQALRFFKAKVSSDNFIVVHVCLLPDPNESCKGSVSLNPVSYSLSEFMKMGINPDIVVCRTRTKFPEGIQAQVNAGMILQQVICVPDVPNVYKVPEMLASQGLGDVINTRLHFERYSADSPTLDSWKELAFRMEHESWDVKIALVAEQAHHSEAYASAVKALNHASVACHRNVVIRPFDCGALYKTVRSGGRKSVEDMWNQIRDCHGMLVIGDYREINLEGKILACKFARENRIPLLAVSSGMYAAIIEFSRSVLLLDGAASVAQNPTTKHPLIISSVDRFNNVRKGLRRTVLSPEPSVTSRLYGGLRFIEERHRSKFQVNTNYVELLESNGMLFVGRAADNSRVDIGELQGQQFYVAVDFHPEFRSAGLRPSPLYVGLILAASSQLVDALSVISFPLFPTHV